MEWHWHIIGTDLLTQFKFRLFFLPNILPSVNNSRTWKFLWFAYVWGLAFGVFFTCCFYLFYTWIHEHKAGLTALPLCNLFPLSSLLCISWALLVARLRLWCTPSKMSKEDSRGLRRLFSSLRSPCKGEEFGNSLTIWGVWVRSDSRGHITLDLC